MTARILQFVSKAERADQLKLKLNFLETVLVEATGNPALAREIVENTTLAELEDLVAQITGTPETPPNED